MTSVDTEAMTALQELLSERQRYEGWIHALEQRKSSTAQHVYDRVYTDYTLRLERVLHRLSERTEQLESTVQEMTSRLATLRGRESDRTDARQEAELRAVVGEYTDEEWTKLRDEADQEISTIAEERGGVEHELAELERIIAMSRAPKTTEQTAAQESSPTPEAAPTPVHAASQSPINAAQASPEPPTLAAQQSPPSQKPSATRTPSINQFIADWPAPPVAATPAPPASVSQAPPAQRTRPTPFSGVPVQPLASTDPSTDSRREQEKTLKCPECSAMNYATEWYCERCGGELATY